MVNYVCLQADLDVQCSTPKEECTLFCPPCSLHRQGKVREHQNHINMHQAPDNLALDIECYLCCAASHKDRDYSQTTTTTTTTSQNSGAADVEGNKQQWSVCGDEKAQWMFLDPTKKCRPLLSEFFSLSKDTGKEQEKQRQSKAEVRVHSWLMLAPAFYTYKWWCKPTQFTPEGWREYFWNISWKQLFPFLLISYTGSLQRLESSGLFSFLTRGTKQLICRFLWAHIGFWP